VESVLHGKLVEWSVPALRIAVGAIFLGFGALKFFPDVSPAQDLSQDTFDKLSFGLVPSGVAIIGIATMECFIGICLLANRWMRAATWILVFELVGILSPLVLLPGRLFDGPGGAPTLEGQYVLKDIVLVAAAMVIVAGAFRRGRMIRGEPRESEDPGENPADFSAERKLELVMDGAGLDVETLCRKHGISEPEFYRWRDEALRGARDALDESHQAGAPDR